MPVSMAGHLKMNKKKQHTHPARIFFVSRHISSETYIGNIKWNFVFIAFIIYSFTQQAFICQALPCSFQTAEK